MGTRVEFDCYDIFILFSILRYFSKKCPCLNVISFWILPNISGIAVGDWKCTGICFLMTNAFCISLAKAVLLCMWKNFRCYFLHTCYFLVLTSTLVLQVLLMYQSFLDQFIHIFLWLWVFVALSNDTMSNLHSFMPCHTFTTFEIVIRCMLLLLSSVTWIVKRM